MGKKKAGSCTEADEHRPVAGAPEIAHPDDDEKWELQTAFFTAFLFETWERVEARNKKASRAARAELQEFLLNSLGQSLRVALDDRDSIAKQWACKLLSDIFVSIGKHVGKVRIKKPYGRLMEIKAFRDEKKRIGKVRTDVLFPGMVRAITQREIKTAARHRRTLLFLKAGCVSKREQKRRGKLAKEHGFELADRERGTTWKQAAERQKIPQPYWPLVKFPEFSPRSFGRWFKFLWPLIREKIELSKLLSLSQRDLDKGGTKNRTRYLSDSQKTAYDHLKALARLRDKGAFYLF